MRSNLKKKSINLGPRLHCFSFLFFSEMCSTSTLVVCRIFLVGFVWKYYFVSAITSNTTLSFCKSKQITYLFKERVGNFQVDCNRRVCGDIQVCICFKSRAPLKIVICRLTESCKWRCGEMSYIDCYLIHVYGVFTQCKSFSFDQ